MPVTKTEAFISKQSIQHKALHFLIRYWWVLLLSVLLLFWGLPDVLDASS